MSEFHTGLNAIEGQPQTRSRVYHHTVMNAYPGDMLAGVAGVHLYGARVLASTSPGDIVMMHPEIEESGMGTVWIEQHYRRVGLSVASNFIFDETLENLDWHTDLPLSAFLFGEEAHGVRPNQLFAKQTEDMNDKNKFIRFCREQGAPTPRTELFDSVTQVETHVQDFPVYVKGAVSASGEHVFRCESEQQFRTALNHMKGAFQIQEELPGSTIFCNIQYSVERWSGERRLMHGPLTRQQLEGNAHNGNVFPAGVDADLIQPITDKLSLALFDLGLDGVWAFDVAVCDKQVYMIECNPRWNGASYSSIPAERLGASKWESVNVKTRHRNFAFFNERFRELEYDPHKGVGIVIINWATILYGKLGLLVVGNESTRQHLIEEFHTRFG